MPAGAEPAARAAPSSRSSGRTSAASVSPNVTSGARARLGELEREPAAVLVADVDRRRRRLRAGEEPALRLVVLLHRPVQVEVILREVREDERVEADAVEPPQRASRATRPRRRRSGHPRRASRGRGAAGRSPRASCAARAAARRRRPTRRCRRARASGPAASSTERSRNVVVVLPFVPVTPATSSARVGSPKKQSAATAIDARASSTSELRHVELERPLDDERDRAGGDRRAPRTRARRRASRARRRTTAPGVTRSAS